MYACVPVKMQGQAEICSGGVEVGGVPTERFILLLV